ncbi:MAG TPA: creatininase family protein [Chloroflexaceae bacterium]|nr:creatininase family protein [Chloroflexaceae bacterium]
MNEEARAGAAPQPGAGETPLWGRYAELRPAELERIRAEAPVAYLPWGGLDWHGPHLPLGLDGFVAESVAERAARRTGGALLPVTSWPAASVPHPASVGIGGATLRAVLADIFAGLARSGWRVAVLINGHYGPAHDLATMAAAEDAIARHGLLALAVPPLALVDEEMLDHGGLWESSVLLATRPDLVDLAALGSTPLRPADSGVVGRDPRDTASPSLGLSALSLALERVIAAVADLLARGDPAPLHALYARRRERYQSFVARYGSDPDQATLAWWAELSAE